FLVNASGHDSDFGFAGRNNAGAVGSDEARAGVLQHAPHLHHVIDRNAFRDADDERQLGRVRFQNRVRRERRRNEDHGGVGARFLHGVFDRVEDRPAFMCGSTLARRHSANNLGAVLGAALGVEGAFFARDALHDEASVFIYQYRHLYLPPLAAATTFCAASCMVSPTIKFKPDSLRILRPSSTFVPSSRSTTGTFTFVFLAAPTTPCARVSTRRMPPKMLMKTACTFLSDSRISKACSICCSLAPPPTSRKLAGIPPA